MLCSCLLDQYAGAIRSKLLLGIAVSFESVFCRLASCTLFTPRGLQYMAFSTVSVALAMSATRLRPMNKALAGARRGCEIRVDMRQQGRASVMRIARRNYPFLLLAVPFALPAASASAQMSPELSFPTQKQQKQLTPEQQKYQKDLDESYKATNKKIPDQKPSDPWATMRSAPSASAPKAKQQ